MAKDRSNRHTLHLPTGQVKRIFITKLPDIQLMKDFVQTFMNLFCRYTEVFQTKRYLIPDGIFGAES